LDGSGEKYCEISIVKYKKIQDEENKEILLVKKYIVSKLRCFGGMFSEKS